MMAERLAAAVTDASQRSTPEVPVMARSANPPVDHSPSSLSSLTRRLLRRTRGVAPSPAVIFGIVGSVTRPRLHSALQPPDLDQLVGFQAPPSWRGVAVVSTGNARPLTVSATFDDDPARVRVAFAVDRDGRSASSLAGEDGEEWWTSTEPVDGFVADLCRRMLGVPCPPEPRSTADLVTAVWLELLLDRSADPATAADVQTWFDVAALHPAATTGAHGITDPDELAGATIGQTREWNWPNLRHRAISGEVHLDEVTPELARWMDDAFLARWLLGMHRSAPELLDDLRLFLRSDLHAMVVRTVTATLGTEPAAPEPPVHPGDTGPSPEGHGPHDRLR